MQVRTTSSRRRGRTRAGGAQIADPSPHNVHVQHRRSSPTQTVAIATLSSMKLQLPACTHCFRLASKHCSAGPITRQKWSEGFRQRQNFGSLFFSSDLVTSHRNASVGMQFVGFTGREGFFRHRNLCLRPPHATDLDGFRARASKKIHGRRSIFGRRCRAY